MFLNKIYPFFRIIKSAIVKKRMLQRRLGKRKWPLFFFVTPSHKYLFHFHFSCSSQ
uniref:Uncharacterized protein n=1 Tax=Heterorhabditis bacteriophora TaxID=37862 RepID=A0A1I7WPE2_HETBA